jgi:hypothetical protein
MFDRYCVVKMREAALRKEAEGSRLAAYEIVRLIGAGGMGDVYRGRERRSMV